MCGIVGGISQRNIVPILLEGLKKLEYRGYDSAGIALVNSEGQLDRVRSLGKIASLENEINADLFSGKLGIAHTRWATHGEPSTKNAHPHMSADEVAIVHNGIIENYQPIKSNLIEKGYEFTSETDSEVIAHLIHSHLNPEEKNPEQALLSAVKKSIANFSGAYALGVLSPKCPDTIIAARNGSPLVVGIGFEEFFIASDVSALLPVTQKFMYLMDGDIALLSAKGLKIFDKNGDLVEREIVVSSLNVGSTDLGTHRHYMHKEIYEQPEAVRNALEGRLIGDKVSENAFGYQAKEIFENTKQVQIIACGTSYHAGLVAKYWFEEIISIPCYVEVASEYRYRSPVIQDNTLLVSISQSGETADTLAALKDVKARAKLNEQVLNSLCICNAPESSLTRESDLTFLTHAGPEIGVASTKAFTTQLVALSLLLVSLGRVHNTLSIEREAKIVNGLRRLPSLIEKALTHEEDIAELAKTFIDKSSTLFLGRGTLYPIALEGALKLKEVSYIHAEAYPAGELKHGPLALVDDQIPVVTIAPKDELLEKLKSNLMEVSARGGKMIVFEDESSNVSSDKCFKVVKVTGNVGRITAPIIFNIPLQLLSYHVALIKGTDVDQPRNLAKSVTVE